MSEQSIGDADERAQRDHVVLSPGDVGALPAALGWNAPRTIHELRDVDDEVFIRDGQPAAGYERLIRSYTDQRAAIMVIRRDAEGNGRQDGLWLSPYGSLRTVESDAGTALTAEVGGSHFRVLIDMLGLQPRPAPEQGFDPVRVSGKLVAQAADFDNGPDVPAEARREIADRVRSIAPAIADCLQIGDAEVVTIIAEWDGAEGDQRSRLIYFDTPAGLLVHSHEVLLLRQKHHLEPAPAWVVFAEVVAGLPRPADVEHWRATSDASAP